MATRILTPRLLSPWSPSLPSLARAASTSTTTTTARAIASSTSRSATNTPRRSFQASARRLDAAGAGSDAGGTTPLPARRPVGALRGAFFGFFFGSTLAGGAVYYSVAKESRVANEMLTQDIYGLEAAIERMSKYMTVLEGRMEALERRKRG